MHEAKKLLVQSVIQEPSHALTFTLFHSLVSYLWKFTGLLHVIYRFLKPRHNTVIKRNLSVLFISRF